MSIRKYPVSLFLLSYKQLCDEYHDSKKLIEDLRNLRPLFQTNYQSFTSMFFSMYMFMSCYIINIICRNILLNTFLVNYLADAQ